MLGNLSNSLYWIKASGNVAAGQDMAEVDGADIDARGFDRALFIVELGAVTTNGKFALQIQESADGDTWADITDAGFAAATATGKSDDTILIDVPVSKGYVRYQYQRTVANVELDAIQVLLYNAKKIPVSQNADVWQNIII